MDEGVNVSEQFEGLTALGWAKRQGHRSCVRLLEEPTNAAAAAKAETAEVDTSEAAAPSTVRVEGAAPAPSSPKAEQAQGAPQKLTSSNPQKTGEGREEGGKRTAKKGKGAKSPEVAARAVLKAEKEPSAPPSEAPARNSAPAQTEPTDSSRAGDEKQMVRVAARAMAAPRLSCGVAGCRLASTTASSSPRRWRARGRVSMPSLVASLLARPPSPRTTLLSPWIELPPALSH